MPLIDPLDDAELTDDVRELVKFFGGPLGMIPNSVRTMARRPEIAKAFTALNKAVMECHGNVTPDLKRMIGYITSQNTGCRYCQAHTALGAKRFGAEDERIDALWDYPHSPLFTDAERAAFDFALAASTVPNAVNKETEDNLKAHWDSGDITEIMGVIALFGYLNRWNDSMSTTLEDSAVEVATDILVSEGWERGKHV